MSASDHLSKNQFRLFHGTNVDIPKGEHIYPGDASENDEIDHESGKHVFDTPRSRWGEDLAFASTNLHDASQYGKNVYEVSVDKDDDKLEYHGSDVYGHPGGFKVKRQLKPEVVERYSNIVAPIREAKEKREYGLEMHQRNSEQWSHQGDKVYHVKWDKEGNEIKTPVAKMGDRPGSN